MGKKTKDTLGRTLIKDRFNKNRHRKHVKDDSMVRLINQQKTLFLFIICYSFINYFSFILQN